MAVIERGEDYIYDDFVDNLVYILEQNKTALGLRFIGTSKDWLAPIYPSIYVIFDNAEERWVHMPRVKDIGITAMIHYYHKNLKASVRKDEIDEALGKIAKILRQNFTCNGFCVGTNEGLSVERVDALGELRGEMGGIGDGTIEVTGVKRIRVENIT